MMPRLSKLLAVGLLALACGSPASPVPSGAASTATPPADFEIEAAQFVNTGGCGDTFLWATNAAGTAAITVEWGGAASAAWANDEFSDTQQLPHPEITVTVIEGNKLTGCYCNDIREMGAGPTSTVEAATGTVEITVRPNREGFEPAGQADLRLTNVSFHVGLGAGDTWRLDELVIENVSVGWLAG
jgi:hypothetical protein